MSAPSLPIPPEPRQPGIGDRLDSWKEIAAYLKREVRTAQRWEKSQGLPVRRHRHDKLSSVFAYRSELDAWWHERQQVLGQEVELPEEEAPPTESAQADEESSQEPVGRVPTRVAPLRTAVAIGVVAIAALAIGVAYRMHKPKEVIPREITKTRMVVLPFQNLSGDPGQDVFCQGLTEAMTTQLGRLDPDHLGVIASTTAFLVRDKPIQEIAGQLGANYVVEGSVLRSGGHVRIDAHLIQTSDQTDRWANAYSRDGLDMISMQNEVAQSIASEIRLTLTPTEQARLVETAKVDPDAYDDYLQGLVSWNERTPQGLSNSVKDFGDAIRKSPSYAPAYAGLADAYSILSAVPTAAIPPRDAMPKAAKAAEDAVRLDPLSAEAHAALGLVRQSYDWDFDGAEQEYERALSINPSYGSARHWHSLLLAARGRHSDAMKEIELARSLDPLSPVIRSTRIQEFYFSRDYDRAIEESRKELEIESDSPIIHYHLGQSLIQKGEFAEGVAQLQKGQTLAGGSSPVFVAALGHAYGLAGDRDSAIKSLAELNATARKGGYIPAVYFSAVYTGLGDRDQAIRWLEKAFDERVEYLIFLNVEPMADPLRSDPRFQSLIRRIGLL